jgi:hypothetical protein
MSAGAGIERDLDGTLERAGDGACVVSARSFGGAHDA